MGRVQCRDTVVDIENEICEAKYVYHTGLESSIRAAASTYGVPYGFLPDRLWWAQPIGAENQNEQLLTPEEEKSIVTFCETLDDLGHQLQGKMIKAFVMSLVPSQQQQQLHKNWTSCFLNCHPASSIKYSQRLDGQGANANVPAIMKDFFSQGISF